MIVTYRKLVVDPGNHLMVLHYIPQTITRQHGKFNLNTRKVLTSLGKRLISRWYAPQRHQEVPVAPPGIQVRC